MGSVEGTMTTSGVSAEMPRYKCHKEVHALQIERIEGQVLHFVDTHFAAIDVGNDYFNRHNPGSGGHYVVYEDGYTSYSPMAAFENGYTRIQ